MEINNIDFQDFISNSFDCPSFESENPLIDFDKLKIQVWSQLRSVDALDIQNNTIVMYEFSTFRDLIEYLKNSNFTEKQALIEQLEEKLKNNLFLEYRAKLFESLFLLSVLGRNLNGSSIEFKIVICAERREDIVFYDILKKKLKKYLANKLQSLFPPGGNDKAVVFISS